MNIFVLHSKSLDDDFGPIVVVRNLVKEWTKSKINNITLVSGFDFQFYHKVVVILINARKRPLWEFQTLQLRRLLS